MVDLTRADLAVAVLDCDQGVGVIRKGVPERSLSFTPDQIDRMGYADLDSGRETLLNLRNPAYLRDFLRDSA